MSRLEPLDKADVILPETLHAFSSECEVFHEFLGSAFKEISSRTELNDVPFDRHEAAETLRMYLAH